LVSFTADPRVARRYALGNDGRREGMLISVRIDLVRQSTLHVPDTNGSVVFADAYGRYWFDLSRYRSASAEAFLGTAAWRDFHRTAVRDSEWLLLGSLAAEELSWSRISTPSWLDDLASRLGGALAPATSRGLRGY
jgi:hypothetical protein